MQYEVNLTPYRIKSVSNSLDQTVLVTGNEISAVLARLSLILWQPKMLKLTFRQSFLKNCPLIVKLLKRWAYSIAATYLAKIQLTLHTPWCFLNIVENFPSKIYFQCHFMMTNALNIPISSIFPITFSMTAGALKTKKANIENRQNARMKLFFYK